MWNVRCFKSLSRKETLLLLLALASVFAFFFLTRPCCFACLPHCPRLQVFVSVCLISSSSSQRKEINRLDGRSSSITQSQHYRVNIIHCGFTFLYRQNSSIDSLTYLLIIDVFAVPTLFRINSELKSSLSLRPIFTD